MGGGQSLVQLSTDLSTPLILWRDLCSAAWPSMGWQALHTFEKIVVNSQQMQFPKTHIKNSKSQGVCREFEPSTL